jgi:hypothetical protein
MKKKLLFLILLAGLVILPLCAEQIGTLKVSSKTVFYKMNQKTDYKQVSGKAALHKGTTVKTGTNGTAFVKYPTLAEINIKKNTIAIFGKSTINMKIGKASYKFIKKGHRFVVKLPTAIIGVLGTAFDIEVNKDRSASVKMTSGVISLKTRKGRMKVEKNRIAMISPEGDVEVKKFVKLPSTLPQLMVKKPLKKEPEPVEEEIYEGEEIVLDKPAEPVPEAPSKVDYEMIGDLDRDGKITNFDIGLLNQLIQKKDEDLTMQERRLGDTDGNGRVEDSDLIKMQIYLEYKVDLNGDGRINESDIETLQEVVKYQENREPCDINKDGKINSFDVNEMKMIVEQLKGCRLGERY